MRSRPTWADSTTPAHGIFAAHAHAHSACSYFLLLRPCAERRQGSLATAPVPPVLCPPLTFRPALRPTACVLAPAVCTHAGFITFKNLKRVAKELGENLTDEEIQEMIDEADRDGDGQVSEEEFFRIMKKTSLF